MELVSFETSSSGIRNPFCLLQLHMILMFKVRYCFSDVFLPNGRRSPLFRTPIMLYNKTALS